MALSKGNNRALNFSISHPVEICVCAGKKKKMYENVYRIIICNSKQLETTLSPVSTENKNKF